MKKYFKSLVRKIEKLPKETKTFIGGSLLGFLVGLVAGGFTVAVIMGSVIVGLIK